MTGGFVHVDVRETYSRWVSKSGDVYKRQDKLYAYLGGNWTLLNDNNFSLGANKSALNGKAKITLDGAKQSSVSIKGTGITTVMTDENGELVVNTGDPSMYMEALTNSDIDLSLIHI